MNSGEDAVLFLFNKKRHEKFGIDDILNSDNDTFDNNFMLFIALLFPGVPTLYNKNPSRLTSKQISDISDIRQKIIDKIFNYFNINLDGEITIKGNTGRNMVRYPEKWFFGIKIYAWVSIVNYLKLFDDKILIQQIVIFFCKWYTFLNKMYKLNPGERISNKFMSSLITAYNRNMANLIDFKEDISFKEPIIYIKKIDFNDFSQMNLNDQLIIRKLNKLYDPVRISYIVYIGLDIQGILFDSKFTSIYDNIDDKKREILLTKIKRRI